MWLINTNMQAYVWCDRCTTLDHKSREILVRVSERFCLDLSSAMTAHHSSIASVSPRCQRYRSVLSSNHFPYSAFAFPPNPATILFTCPILSAILPLSPEFGGTSSAATKRRTMTLKMLPKARAITVEVSMI